MIRERIVQIHPTLLCNLRCSHCYSNSGPTEQRRLPKSLLCDFIEDAAEEGYTVVSVSGGEPLMYPYLDDILKLSRSLGMKTTVTSNGMLLNDARVSSLAEHLNLLAFSLDGIPESHNTMRGHPRAFEIMESKLESVRRANIPFGFIFTLTQYNLDEVIWVTEYAVQMGASLLQIHPLEEVGRARQEMVESRPDGTEISYALLVVKQLEDMFGDKIKFQLDVVSKGMMLSDPSRFYSQSSRNSADAVSLSELLSPIVLEADGTVVPLQYGFPRKHALGNIYSDRLSSLAGSWKKNGESAFYDHCTHVFQKITSDDLPVVNWFEIASMDMTAGTK